MKSFFCKKFFFTLALCSFSIVAGATDTEPLGTLGTIKMATPNSQMQKILDQLKARGGKPIETLTAKQARRQPTPADAVKALMRTEGKKADRTGIFKVIDRKIAGAAGPIPARMYWPISKAGSSLPVILYYHGGGFVIANKEVYDATPRALSKQVNAIVVSIDYRQAPENKFPAAHDDAFAAYKWVVENANSFGGDANKIAVAGESAGANLALNVALRARDEGVKLPVHELLVYPVAGSNMNTPSYIENEKARPLNKAMMVWFFKNYLKSPEEAKDKRIDLVSANLKGLPPATVITAQIDPLRSEGKELADQMIAQRMMVKYQNFDGVTHEFFGMASVLKEAKEAQQFAVDQLKNSFL